MDWIPSKQKMEERYVTDVKTQRSLERTNWHRENSRIKQKTWGKRCLHYRNYMYQSVLARSASQEGQPLGVKVGYNDSYKININMAPRE